MIQEYTLVAKLICNRTLSLPYRYKDFFEEGQGKLRMKYMPTNHSPKFA